jgi:nitrogen fixation-related uncharacterized protein
MGQYEDTYSPSVRILFDDTHPVEKPAEKKNKQKKKKSRKQP